MVLEVMLLVLVVLLTSVVRGEGSMVVMVLRIVGDALGTVGRGVMRMARVMVSVRVRIVMVVVLLVMLVVLLVRTGIRGG